MASPRSFQAFSLSDPNTERRSFLASLLQESLLPNPGGESVANTPAPDIDPFVSEIMRRRALETRARQLGKDQPTLRANAIRAALRREPSLANQPGIPRVLGQNITRPIQPDLTLPVNTFDPREGLRAVISRLSTATTSTPQGSPIRSIGTTGAVGTQPIAPNIPITTAFAAPTPPATVFAPTVQSQPSFIPPIFSIPQQPFIEDLNRFASFTPGQLRDIPPDVLEQLTSPVAGLTPSPGIGSPERLAAEAVSKPGSKGLLPL